MILQLSILLFGGDLIFASWARLDNPTLFKLCVFIYKIIVSVYMTSDKYHQWKLFLKAAWNNKCLVRIIYTRLPVYSYSFRVSLLTSWSLFLTFPSLLSAVCVWMNVVETSCYYIYRLYTYSLQYMELERPLNHIRAFITYRSMRNFLGSKYTDKYINVRREFHLSEQSNTSHIELYLLMFILEKFIIRSSI